MAAFHRFSLFLILSTVIFVNAGRSRRSPIVTNDLATPHQFPWAVAIVSYENSHVCSGGIISERHILSAAHCFLNPAKNLRDKGYAVYPGTINYKLAMNLVYSVKRVFARKDFRKRPHQSDIAVLELVDNLQIQGHNLAILALPSQSRMIANGERGQVAAFGACNLTIQGKKKTVERDGRLRYANIRIVDRPECHEKPCCMAIFSRNPTIGNYSLLGQMEKESTQIFGMCDGDSGACLVQSSGQVIGLHIAGFDRSCDERNQSSIYTKVSYYVPFIRQAMSGKLTQDIIVRECQPY